MGEGGGTPASRRRHASCRTSLPLLVVLAFIAYLSLGPGRAATGSQQTSRKAGRWYQQSHEYVPLLPDGDGAEAEKAHLQLRLLLTQRYNNATKFEQLMLKRQKALDKLLDTDNRVRRYWNVRLAAAQPRGIVVCAGGSQPLANTFVVLYVLRRVLGCRLPAAILHWGPDEVGSGTAAFFHSHVPGVEFIDVSRAAYPEHHAPLWDGAARPSEREVGYKIKVAALYLAPFREVFMVDSDSLPLQNLTPLFDSPVYRRTGALFWPDLWTAKPGVWDILPLASQDPWQHWIAPWDEDLDGPVGLNGAAAASRRTRTRSAARRLSVVTVSPSPPESASERRARIQNQAESGQIVLDRARHWRALEWALFLNTHDSIVYTRPGMLGDKDTFRPAFALAGSGRDFRQVPYPPAIPVIDRHTLNITDAPRYRYTGLLQFHPDGSALFHHRTSWSKFPACGGHGELAGPLTHISTPASPTQARLYEWHGGLLESHVRVVRCGQGGSCPACSLRALAHVDDQCTGRSEEDREREPTPVTLVEVEPGSYIHAASSAAAAAHQLFPFGE